MGRGTGVEDQSPRSKTPLGRSPHCSRNSSPSGKQQKQQQPQEQEIDFDEGRIEKLIGVLDEEDQDASVEELTKKYLALAESEEYEESLLLTKMKEMEQRSLDFTKVKTLD